MFKAKAGLHSDITVIDVVEQNEFARLTEVVCDHLASIQDALRAYQKVDTPHDTTVSEELQAVLARVRLIEKESDQTKDLLKTEKHKSTHDELTGLPNRAAYNERAFHELRRFKRYHRPLSLAVCDIDHFKKINDQYGHRAGDKSLALIAKYLESKFRTVDFVARLGGEEFVMILPETNEDQAARVLDKIRDAIAKIPFKFNKKPFQISVSFGISQFVADDTMESVFERADKALYAAKTNGRNQVRIESAPEKKKDKHVISVLNRKTASSDVTPAIVSKF
ncbi:MAG: GGDEF domain-containing protein [Agarilytica sp.]